MKFDVIRLAAGIVIFAIILALLVVGKAFLIPLAVAIIIWTLLDALRVRFARLRILGRTLPQGTNTFFAAITILAVLFLIYHLIVSQAAALDAAAPVYQANLESILNDIFSRFPAMQSVDREDIVDNIDLGKAISAVAGSASVLLGNIALICIYLGFFIAESKTTPKKLQLLQAQYANARLLPELVANITSSIQRYIWMKTLISLLTGFTSYAVLTLVGVDFAAIWGLLIFLLNFIPNIGSIMGVIFPALLTLIQFDTITPFFVVSLGLGFVQFFIGNVVEPAFMGKSLNLSSLMIILSLTFWGIVWGIAGMFLAVPMMVVSAIVFAQFSNTRWIAILMSSDGHVITDTADNSNPEIET